MTTTVSAAADAPSAELLLYLAEFADDEGQPEDPVALTREQRKTPATRDDPSSEESDPTDAQRPAPTEVAADD